MQIKVKTPTVLDVEPYISERAKLWRSSQIRSFFPLEHTPGVVSLLAGKPNPATFPFEAITLTVKSPIPDEAVYDIRIDGQDLDRALQYGITGGLPDFVKWLEDFQSFVHGNDKERENWQVVVGNGSQDLLTKAFQILVNEGDSILVETPAFPCAEGYFNLLPSQDDVDILNAKGLPTPEASELISVRTDGGGLSADHLRSILESWPQTHPDKKKPVVLYTVPIAGNPTGSTIDEERKAEVLRLAKEHDFIILEDDAYAYLYYGDAPKPRSYFAMEAEINGEVGRVMRFDSFSKILSSGMRLGFITAPKRVCELIVLNTANVNLQCSSTTQMLALKLLSSWGHRGLVAHCDRVAAFYKTKRDMFEKAAQRHLKGVATWTTPVAGMFLYIELAPLPDGTKLDSYTLITERALKGGVLCVPGAAFMPRGMKSSFVRASFSLADEAIADEAFRRLRVVIEEARSDSLPS